MQRHVKPSIRKLVILRDKRCIYCGKPVAKVIGDDVPYSRQWKAYDEQDKVFHFEHQIPLADGGPNDESNIVLACPECNLKKAREEATQRAIRKGGAMSRTVKLDDQVYDRLERVRVKGETFSQVVERLLAILEAFKGISPRINPEQVNQEFSAARARARGIPEP